MLTDIRMPVFDGLELIKKTRELGLETAFIIISGYRQFEYAKRAIEFGVEDYLVKPIEAEMLNQALGKATDSVKRRKSEMLVRSQVRQLTRENEQQEKERFWYNILSDQAPGEVAVDEMENTDEDCYYQAVVIRTDIKDFNIGQSVLFSKVKALCEEQFIFVAIMWLCTGIARLWRSFTIGAKMSGY